MTWEDGKPITSKDIKYGIERVWAQDVLSGGPVYLKDILDPKGEYKGPYKDTSAAPVRQDKDTKSKYGLKPFSSGPYKFQSYTPNKSLTLVRNPEWKASSDKIRKAYPDKITLTFFTNANDMDQRLINGDYDLDANQTGGLSPQGRTTALKQHKANLDNPVSGRAPRARSTTRTRWPVRTRRATSPRPRKS